MTSAHDILEEALHNPHSNLALLASTWATRYEGIDAATLLKATQATLKQRGMYRDKENERIMPKIVERFNQRREGPNLTITQGYHFMIDLKLTRLDRNPYNIDSIIDLLGYTALLGEHLSST